MGTYETGSLLTCVHDCGCRIRVEVECHCPQAGEPYRCTCGAEMVAAEDPSGGRERGR
jgi:metallothionein